ncbi:MAG: response regulator [Elusimicrobiota bacterium]
MSDASEKTILIVDDEPDVRLFMQTILEDAGFRVMLASNGKQALDRVKERRPDAISLDLVMPKMSGLKFYRYIKKHKDNRDIPFVIVTAHAKDEFGTKDLQELQEEAAGENLRFLEKPVKPAAYVDAIRAATGLTSPDVEPAGQSDLREQVKSRLGDADEDKLREALRILSRKKE